MLKCNHFEKWYAIWTFCFKQINSRKSISYMLGGPSKWSTRMWPISNDLPDLQMSSIDHIWQYKFLTFKILFVIIMFYSIHFMEHENSVTAPEIFCFCKIYIRKLHLYRACNAFRNYRYWYHTKTKSNVWLMFL